MDPANPVVDADASPPPVVVGSPKEPATNTAAAAAKVPDEGSSGAVGRPKKVVETFDDSQYMTPYEDGYWSGDDKGSPPSAVWSPDILGDDAGKYPATDIAGGNDDSPKKRLYAQIDEDFWSNAASSESDEELEVSAPDCYQYL